MQEKVAAQTYRVSAKLLKRTARMLTYQCFLISQQPGMIKHEFAGATLASAATSSAAVSLILKPQANSRTSAWLWRKVLKK